MHIALIALGTRGDVQPLALLSWQLQHGTESAAEVTLISHAAHQTWLEDLLGSSSHVKLLYVSSSPAAVWQQQVEHNNNINSSTDAKYRAAQTKDPSISASSSNNRENVRMELLLHCCTALSCQWPPATHLQQQQQQQRLMIFNLFALEGYHVSDALHIPCLVAQPYLIPYSMPASFTSRFKKSLPALYEALQAAADENSSSSSSVTWKDISHWMWPLFTERWGAWRQQQLHLDPLPLVTAWKQQQQQQQQQGSVYKDSANHITTASSSSGGKDGSSSSSRHDACFNSSSSVQVDGLSHDDVRQGPMLPPAVPVLYGVSPSVVCAPGFWPAAVQLTGFWLVRDMHAQTAWQQQQQQQQQQCGTAAAAAAAMCQLPVDLQQFLDCCRCLKERNAARIDHHDDGLCQQDHHQQRSSISFDQLRCKTSRSTGGNSPLAAAAAAAVGHITTCQGLLLVDFGSMGLLGLLTDPPALLKTVVGALKQLNWCGVLMSNNWQPLVDAYTNTLTTSQQQRLYLQQQSITCHHLLLDQVDVVLHHGGSGTTAAAAAAGVPQLICPLQFDQFYWAETMRHLGCSPAEPLSMKLLLPQNPTAKQQQQQEKRQVSASYSAETAAAAVTILVDCILAARKPTTVQCCRQLRQDILAENGLHKAAQEITTYLRNQQTLPSSN